ncbi:metalloprotease PmbA [Alcaligenes endophyticus]|uniref:Metalloprotease PmbA n=1 Tax=Alcaligenes endophyticus TaxID=1929088 RepID=A0ABT8EM40_9BURK|nr:metalloprotease PmbA [Alcaligenes endophyticus]MCX5591067.1 metalloprotease PmbA [Alcaligenes endophyticus]MDN4122355.1 metalloprotease PmbA [Alcaligenes endophyticus]
MSQLPITEHQFQFCELLADALQHAKKLGASDAAVDISESKGLSVSVRQLELETVEQTQDRSMGVTVYAGQRRGSASTSDFSLKALRQTVEAAWHIARYTAEDPAAGLPQEDQLASDYPDLQLHYPWDISAEQAVRLAVRAEQAALELSPQITNSEGAGLDTNEGHFVMGNSRGFLGGYAFSRHSMSVSPIAGKGNAMHRDYWHASKRRYSDLPTPESIGRYAAERTLARLSARKIPTGKYPVLFEAPLAVGLLGALVQATSGGALYRQSSFLLDSLGKRVLAPHIQVSERPHLRAALGSAPFDAEGVRTSDREIVIDGVLQSYFLSSYSARKLGMQTTGSAGGSHNLFLRSSQAEQKDDLNAMLKKMGTGLFVTELIGQGVNYLTGDYSRGAFGYWVENGVIQHAVEEITIAGNLKEMFQQVVAVGSDELTRGSKTSGSILIESMSVAGA